MAPRQEHELLDRLANGRLAPRDLFGLSPKRVAALRGLAEGLANTQPADAAHVYDCLAVLEPDQPRHLLSRALCLASAGQTSEASSCLDRYLRADGLPPPEDQVRSLLLHARLHEASSPALAAASRELARELARGSQPAEALLAQEGP